MPSMQEKKPLWKNAIDITGAKKAVDFGVLLKWAEAKHMVKILDQNGQAELVRHFAVRLADRATDRLAAEILIESLFGILTAAGDESLMVAFLEELFNSSDFEVATRHLVELSLNAEVGEDPVEQSAMATAVALICELGLNVQRIEEESPGHIPKARALIDHIAAYLLSVSNTNVQAVRLSLMRYFCQTEYGDGTKRHFNRLMARFGHTLMDVLFQQVFNKKSEAVALQYLLENLPCALEAVGDAQYILHETFKQYMLKIPERFSLFMHTLGDQVLSLSSERELCPAAESYFRHLVALYKVTSDLGHKHLGRELLSEMYKFNFIPHCDTTLSMLSSSTQLRKVFREMAAQYRNESKSKGRVHVISQFRLSKRGRKPSLNKRGEFGFLQQVTTLGAWELPRSA